jgi:hypothetical protein
MEDLDKVTKAHLGCSYYAMRALHKTADLILCPYNYVRYYFPNPNLFPVCAYASRPIDTFVLQSQVFDANIRNALEIELTGNAVVIDEGHNVEDVCRDGASGEVSKKDLDDMNDQLMKMCQFLPDAQGAARFTQPLQKWVTKCLNETKGKGKFGRQKLGAFGGPVTAGAGEMLWKGTECVTAMAQAFAPRYGLGAFPNPPHTVYCPYLTSTAVIKKKRTTYSTSALFTAPGRVHYVS